MAASRHCDQGRLGLGATVRLPGHGRLSVPQLQKRLRAGDVARTSVGLADDLLRDAHDLAARGDTEQRKSYIRRAISTAYYAVFHLFVEDFVEHWEFEDQRARLGRMFNHRTMRNAAFAPKDKRNPTPLEKDLVDVGTAFEQL